MNRRIHMLLLALLILTSSALDRPSSNFEWKFDGDLTDLLDFTNEYFEEGSRFVVFGSFAAHLASHGMIEFRDIDIVLLQPHEISPEETSLDLGNRTLIQYHGRSIDLKTGFVASLDELLDAVNINAVSVAFEFEKKGRDELQMISNLKDEAFDEFLQTRTLKILDPKRATPNDCIRVLVKAQRYKYGYSLDAVSQKNCARPQILSREKATMARKQLVGGAFGHRVYDVEDSFVWAKSQAEARDYFAQESRRGKTRGRRALWWDSEDEAGYYETGSGKCVTTSGADPSHKYFHGIGHEQCRLKCDYDPACWGFSVSSSSNCLHWMQNDIKAGGAPWGEAKCWIAQGVVENGRRTLSSVRKVVSSDRRLLNRLDAFALSAGYYDVGLGKCQTSSGGDPAHKYLHGVGEDACRSKCDNDSQCHGFSVSIYGNCLHWTTEDLKENAGSSWGGAHCWIAQKLLDSRFGNTVQHGRRKN